MSDPHQIVDRRRLSRKVTTWRVIAFLLAVLLIVGAVVMTASDSFDTLREDHIARVDINGVITGDRPTIELLRKVEKSSSVKALILDINSPGGTTTGSEALYEAVRKVAAKKPVVAQLGTLAASGGYIAALSADHVVSRRNTLTGSIGVIFQWANVKGLLDNVGVKFDTVKSAPLKAEPNPFTDTSPEAKQAMEALVADSYDWFVGLVAERRNMPLPKARALADGRVYTGKQALENGLVDEIGGEDAVRAWLQSNHGIAKDADIRTYAPQAPLDAWGVKTLLNWVGLGRLAGLDSAGGPEFGGLVSVWTPQTLDR